MLFVGFLCFYGGLYIIYVLVVLIRFYKLLKKKEKFKFCKFERNF